MCAYLKEKFPTVEILFLGKGYTRSIVEAYSKVDQFIDWNDFENQVNYLLKNHNIISYIIIYALIVLIYRNVYELSLYCNSSNVFFMAYREPSIKKYLSILYYINFTNETS